MLEEGNPEYSEGSSLFILHSSFFILHSILIFLDAFVDDNIAGWALHPGGGWAPRGVPVRLQDQPQVAGVQARAGPPSLHGALNTST